MASNTTATTTAVGAAAAAAAAITTLSSTIHVFRRAHLEAGEVAGLSQVLTHWGIGFHIEIAHHYRKTV